MSLQTTAGEQTRLPRVIHTQREKALAEVPRDDVRYDYQEAQIDEPAMPGAHHSQCAAHQESLGWETISTDPAVTGHANKALQRRPKEIGDRIRAKQSRAPHKTGGAVSVAELREGVVTQGSALTLSEAGASLPSASERRNEAAETERAAEEFAGHPAVQKAAEGALRELNLEELDQ